MIVLFGILSLPNEYIMDNTWSLFTPAIAILCWLGGWLHLLAFHDRNSRQACYDLIKIAFMVIIVFGIIAGIGYIALSNSLDSYSNHSKHSKKHNIFNNNITLTHISLHFVSGHAFDFVLGGIFVICLICIELRIIFLWKNIKVRYHYFGIQLIACINLVMIFSIFNEELALLASLLLVLYNTAILWNDMMHKRLMSHLTMSQYVSKYRPILTPINLCCECFSPKPRLINKNNQNNINIDNNYNNVCFITKCCVNYFCCCFRSNRKGCRGGWVFQIYAGLILGRISNTDYSTDSDL